MNILLPLLAFLLTPGAADEPVPATQPAASAPTAQGEPADWAVPDFRFAGGEVGTPADLYRLSSKARGLVRYAVQFRVTLFDPGNIAESVGVGTRPEDFSRTSTYRELSPDQLALMRASEWLRARQGSGESACTVQAFAASESDARAVVHGLLELINAKHRKELESWRASAAALPADLAEASAGSEKATARVSELTPLRKQLAAKLGHDDPEQAERDEAELARVARALSIETTGIQAKLAAIAKARTDGPKTAETEAALVRMQLEQSVELAGALARQAAVEEQVAIVRKFRETAAQLSEATAVVRDASQRIRELGSMAQEYERLLESPRPELRPVDVVGGIVTIQRVEHLR